MAFPAGAHGGDGARLAAWLGVAPQNVLDLSASLNPVAPDPAPAVARQLGAIGRYPDAAPATVALATAMAVDPDWLLLTNGGAEAIALVAAELGPGQVDEPDFSLYRRYLPGVIAGGPRWRSNPHNPSGRLAAAGEQAAVWDEAFWPLATGTWTRGDADAGAVVLGSLTKLFACPGLRLGYILCADGDRIRNLRRRQPEWAVNALALGALPELLSGADLPSWTAQVGELRQRLAALLAGHGLDVETTDANWVLVHRADDLRDRLARFGVLVRDCASFGMAGTVRVAVPAEPGLQRLEEALSGS